MIRQADPFPVPSYKIVVDAPREAQNEFKLAITRVGAVYAVKWPMGTTQTVYALQVTGVTRSRSDKIV